MRFEKEIPLSQAKEMIISALSEFDAPLGERAANVLNNRNHNIIEVNEAKTSMMQCRPAGVTRADLEKSGMLIENYVKRFGPHFTEQENLTEHAIIDFEYTGDYQSVSWLAHELGHALANDIQHKLGLSFYDFSMDEHEHQAYFIQTIVSESLMNQNSSYGRDHFGLGSIQTSFDRAVQVLQASSYHAQALNTQGVERTNFINNVLGGEGRYPTNVEPTPNKAPSIEV